MDRDRSGPEARRLRPPRPVSSCARRRADMLTAEGVQQALWLIEVCEKKSISQQAEADEWRLRIVARKSSLSLLTETDASSS
jgi:hypothetical protein